VDDAIIEEHNREVENLGEQMMAIRDIARDLNNLVGEQGVALNIVEDNVNTAETRVDDGVKHIEEASVLQCVSRKRCCCIIIVVAVVIALIIIFGVVGGLGLFNKASPAPTPTPTPTPTP